MNRSVIVNLGGRKFGCSRACSYCNWRSSDLLPRDPPDMDAIHKFASKCAKGFVTISGGAEPLWKYDENARTIAAIVDAIQSTGKQARLITREVETLARAASGLLEHASISLDKDNINAVRQFRSELPRNTETSIVLPPLPTHMIRELLPRYQGIVRETGLPLVLRENLNSPFDLYFGELPTVPGIKYLPRSVCLDTIYLLGDKVMRGNEMHADIGVLLRVLRPWVVVGSFVKHLVAPVSNPDYADIDVIIQRSAWGLLKTSLLGISYEVERESLDDSEVNYAVMKSKRGLPPVHATILSTKRPIDRVRRAQYNIDRIYFQGNRVSFTYEHPEHIHADLERKIAREYPSEDSPYTKEARDRMRAKYIKRGFKIMEAK